MALRDSATGRALKFASMTAGVSGSYLGYLAQSLFLDSNKRGVKLKETHTKAARRASDELIGLRGPAMKLGQVLSLQTEFLPEETLAELTKLQMRAPGMHPSLVRAQFRASMGRDPDDVFAAFDPIPFAAASLGQLHRATTRDGETVAVKIQYPGIRAAIENDFKWFRTLSLPARISKHLPAKVIDEMQEQILAETDYGREAANLTLFRKKLKSLSLVEVPRVYPALSGDQVLTMSLIEGEHIDTFLTKKPSQQLRDAIGSHLLELYVFQLLEMGAFHADPHWGNYLFRDDGSIGVVDFGCVKFVPPAFVANLRAIFLYPGLRDSAAFRRLLAERYPPSGRKLSPAILRVLVRFSETFFAKVYPPDPEAEKDVFDFGNAEFLKVFARESANLIAAKCVFPEYVFMARAEAGMYQTLHRLRARVHTSRIVRKYLAQ
jgi:predicted unusual protein kinase regulating ubiquinone biosynthesis (AarF/ABC1/UbiB family)